MFKYAKEFLRNSSQQSERSIFCFPGLALSKVICRTLTTCTTRRQLFEFCGIRNISKLQWWNLKNLDGTAITLIVNTHRTIVYSSGGETFCYNGRKNHGLSLAVREKTIYFMLKLHLYLTMRVEASLDILSTKQWRSRPKILGESKCLILDQGWPTRRSWSTGRSPSVNWSITPDFAFNWQYTWKGHLSISIPLYCILWLFVPVALLPTRRSRVIKKFSSRSQ